MKKLVLVILSFVVLCSNIYGESYRELPKNQQEIWSYNKVQIVEFNDYITVVVPLTDLGPNLPQYDEVPDHRHTMVIENLKDYYSGPMYTGRVIQTNNFKFHVVGVLHCDNGAALPVADIIKK